MYMALRTKLNTGDEGQKNGLDEVDDLDAVYVNELKSSGLDQSLLDQFLDISKELAENKKNK